MVRMVSSSTSLLAVLEPYGIQLRYLVIILGQLKEAAVPLLRKKVRVLLHCLHKTIMSRKMLISLVVVRILRRLL
jgi:hypothetical protein